MTLESFLNYIYSTFDFNASLGNVIVLYFTRIWKNYPDKIGMIESHNISMLTNDELIVEWMIGKGYFQIRIKENDIRCEVKFSDGSRFGKYHPLPLKMIEVLEQSINRLIEEEVNG